MDISALFLPEDLLEHFRIIRVLELGDCSTKKMIFEIHLEEKNRVTRYFWGDRKPLNPK